MTDPRFRRIYDSYKYGERINRITLNAEAFFLRLNSIVDEHGNCDANPFIVYHNSMGIRCADNPSEDVGEKFELSDIQKWIEELVRVDLVRRYEDHGKKYLHVVDYIVYQPPCAKNGKRFITCPWSPWDQHEMDERKVKAQAKAEGKKPPTSARSPKPKEVEQFVGLPEKEDLAPYTPIPDDKLAPSFAETLEDDVDRKVRNWINSQNFLVWNHLDHGTMATMVKDHGWDETVLEITKAAADKKQKPFGYARAVLRGRAAEKSLTSEKMKSANAPKSVPFEI